MCRPPDAKQQRWIERRFLSEFGLAPDWGETWWLVLDGPRLVAFASAAQRSSDKVVQLTSCYVAPRARRHGLQIRLLRARLAWARQRAAPSVWTYTRVTNQASARNCNRAGLWYAGAIGPWLYWRRVFR